MNKLGPFSVPPQKGWSCKARPSKRRKPGRLPMIASVSGCCRGRPVPSIRTFGPN